MGAKNIVQWFYISAEKHRFYLQKCCVTLQNICVPQETLSSVEK